MAITREIRNDIKSVYRYAESKWNKALIEKGSVRIGTLYDYRSCEHKAGISDPHEGIKWVHHPIRHFDGSKENLAYSSIDARAIEQMGLFASADGGPFKGRISNINMIRVLDDPDCFIHCTSYVLGKNVMSEFEGADSCVEIHDYQGFYKTLTEAINKVIPVQWGGFSIVQYQPRNERFNGDNLGIPASLIKSFDFSTQFEARAVWHPLTDKPINWMALELPELTKFCRIVNLNE